MRDRKGKLRCADLMEDSNILDVAKFCLLKVSDSLRCCASFLSHEFYCFTYVSNKDCDGE